jgi:cytochrome c oxidase subunit 2
VAREAEAAATDPMAKGRQVFNQNGCNACHVLADAKAVGQVGPSLEGIGAEAGKLVPGQNAEEYLRASIIAPNDHVVEGYPANVMPGTYGTSIPEADLEALVDYLLAQQ